MDLQAIDPTERIPRNRWSTEQKLFLCCLYKFFRRDRRDFKVIFNHAFRRELIQCGFTEGVSTGPLEAMWSMMKRTDDPMWGHVRMSPFHDRGPWFSMIERIKECAKALNITLIEKEADDIETSNFQPRQESPPAVFEPADDMDEGPATASNARALDTSAIRNPVEISRHHYTDLSLCTGGWKRCLWCHKEGVKQQEVAAWIPPILYRWSNINSQGVNSTKMFLAGLFTDELEYFAPDDIEAHEFEQHIVNHVSIAKVPTPFISTFRSMLAPVHRAIKHKEGAIVTMIDPQKLPTQVFSAKELLRKIGLRIGRYTGAGEFFIWGKISSSAIISSWKISSLLQITSEHPHIESILQLGIIGAYDKAGRPLHRALEMGKGQLGHQSGLSIGELLARLQVPPQYCHLIAQGIVYSWRFNREESSWEDFIEGVNIGYSSQVHDLWAPLPAISDADNSEMFRHSSDDDTVTDGGSSDDDNDDQHNDNDLSADTSESPKRAVLPTIELFDSSIRRWITQEEHTREGIMADDTGDEIVENVEDIFATNGFPNTLFNINMNKNNNVEGSTSESPGPELIETSALHHAVKQDQFASDRARVNQVLK
ncbi:hypothetical protein ETB97_001780 [Aspergillus alliaceus]|uniref:DUF7587 domain-containing protein n=1 Tax=Petromyces alliaceus TaxID=209559 RepID=A0A8H6A1P1_PETAA|nr:hypothetical protein ETB97_001780 [Aspergillus burnettii]